MAQEAVGLRGSEVGVMAKRKRFRIIRSGGEWNSPWCVIEGPIPTGVFLKVDKIWASCWHSDRAETICQLLNEAEKKTPR